jgi:hypothetical protein
MYIKDTQRTAWDIVAMSHYAMDSVLREEKILATAFGEKKYSFETKGRQTVKVYSHEYAAAYHKILDGMVERRMRSAVKMVASYWYTAWVDAGQPDLDKLIGYKPSEAELATRRGEIEEWKKLRYQSRSHESGNE